MSYLKANKSILRLFSVVFLVGAFLDFGYEIFLAGQQKGLQADINIIKFAQSNQPASDLFNHQLSEGEEEVSSKYSLQQHSFNYKAYDLCFNVYQVSGFACTKIRGPVLLSASELIVRQHRLII